MVKDRQNVLVIVGREAEPPALVEALRHRSGDAGFTLLVPATPYGGDDASDWADALVRAERGAAALRGGGIEVVETIVGDADFAAAAGDVLHSREIDDVIVLVDPEAAIVARPDLVTV
ncbi:MAG TPA: hypothetical protein VMH33_07220 [Solirubrobacterales bacterium]|nr:hypothetical protein [Solirubrobacterales bacterium]